VGHGSGVSECRLKHKHMLCLSFVTTLLGCSSSRAGGPTLPLHWQQLELFAAAPTSEGVGQVCTLPPSTVRLLKSDANSSLRCMCRVGEESGV